MLSCRLLSKLSGNVTRNCCVGATNCEVVAAMEAAMFVGQLEALVMLVVLFYYTFDNYGYTNNYGSCKV